MNTKKCTQQQQMQQQQQMMMVTTKMFAEVDSKRQLTFPLLALYPLVC